MGASFYFFKSDRMNFQITFNILAFIFDFSRCRPECGCSLIILHMCRIKVASFFVHYVNPAT